MYCVGLKELPIRPSAYARTFGSKSLNQRGLDGNIAVTVQLSLDAKAYQCISRYLVRKIRLSDTQTRCWRVNAGAAVVEICDASVMRSFLAKVRTPAVSAE